MVVFSLFHGRRTREMGDWGESKVNQGQDQGAAKKTPQLGPRGSAAKNPPTWVQGWSAKTPPTHWKGRRRVKVSARVQS